MAWSDKHDHELLALVQNGSRLAFAELVQRHTERFYRLAFRYLQSKEAAEDVVQDAFLKLWAEPGKWQADKNTKFTTWFYRVVVNLCLDWQKRKRPVRLSLNDRIHIAEFTLKNAEEILRIIEARFAQGSVSGLEVSQQRIVVNGFRTALASLFEQRATTANALAILLGQSPQHLPIPNSDLASITMPQVNLTPPSSLLTARPDIRSAEASLRAANANIGAARAAFFPSLTLGVDLTIAAGFGGPAVAATSIASSLLAPIFTGGKLTGNLENVTARQKELAAQYQQAVLTSFREVEDGLSALKSANDRAVIARASVVESQNAYHIAKARFDAGAIDYLNLLDAQRSLFQAQDSEIAINQSQLQSFVQLRKAIGS